MALYDAFVSYSHAKDKPIAAALQSVVQKLGKPWYKRRALRVYRDDTSLARPAASSSLTCSTRLLRRDVINAPATAANTRRRNHRCAGTSIQRCVNDGNPAANAPTEPPAAAIAL